MPRGEPPPGLRARRRRRRTAAAPSEPSTRQVARGQRPPVTGHDQGERSELRYRHARQQGDPGQRPTAERGLVQPTQRHPEAVPDQRHVAEDPGRPHQQENPGEDPGLPATVPGHQHPAGRQTSVRIVPQAAEQVVGGHQSDQREHAEGRREHRGRCGRGRVSCVPVPLVHGDTGAFQEPHHQRAADDQEPPLPTSPQPPPATAMNGSHSARSWTYTALVGKPVGPARRAASTTVRLTSPGVIEALDPAGKALATWQGRPSPGRSHDRRLTRSTRPAHDIHTI